MGGSVLYRPSAAVALLLLGLLIGCGTADVQEFGPELHACRADADCTLVYTDVCGGIGAIHVEFVKAWNEHMDIERAKHRGVVCEPAIPHREL